MDAGVLKFFGVMVSIGIAVALPFGLVAIFQAFGKRIQGRSGAADQDLDALHRRVSELEEIQMRDLDDLRARLALLEQASLRLAELEERVDFSERLLVQGRAGAIAPGGERAP